MKKKYSIVIRPLIIISLSLLLSVGCRKESKPELPEISIINISQESDWDYFVVGKKDYYFLKVENSLPNSVLFHSSEAKKDYSIFFSKDGNLDKVAIDNYIFIFRNFDGSKADIGIIDPTGNVKLLKAVETNCDWTTTASKNDKSLIELSDVI